MTTVNINRSMLACVAVMLNLAACQGQGKNVPGQEGKNDAVVPIDSPQVDIRVNRQYDEDGNLIAFDSTYTSIFRGRAGDASFMDSVFQDFKPRFGTRFPFLTDPGFNDLFFQDSLFHHDFFHGDFFRKRMEMNQRFMERMMAEMDSMKNAYLEEQARQQGPVY